MFKLALRQLKKNRTFTTLNILGLTRTLILRQYGITVSTFFNATIGALVVAKVVLVVGVLPFTRPG